MDDQKDWTWKLAASALVAGPIYQVLTHDMPISFEPENSEHLRLLQKANDTYIQGMIIQKPLGLRIINRQEKNSPHNSMDRSSRTSRQGDSKGFNVAIPAKNY